MSGRPVDPDGTCKNRSSLGQRKQSTLLRHPLRGATRSKMVIWLAVACVAAVGVRLLGATATPRARTLQHDVLKSEKNQDLSSHDVQSQSSPTFEGVATALLNGSSELDELLTFVHTQFFFLDADVSFASKSARGDGRVALRDQSRSDRGVLTVFREHTGTAQSYEITLFATMPWGPEHKTDSMAAELSFAFSFQDDAIDVFNVCGQIHVHQTRDLEEQIGNTGSLRIGAIQEFRPDVARWMPITLLVTRASEEYSWTRTLGDWHAKQPQSLADSRFESLLGAFHAIRIALQESMK